MKPSTLAISQNSPASNHDRENALLLAPLYPPAFRGGGPIRSAHAIVSNAPDSIHAHVLTSCRDLGEVVPLPVLADQWIPDGDAQVYYSSAVVWRILRALAAGRKLRPRIVHINSFFTPMFSILPMLLARAGFWRDAVIVLSPRGEFGDAALRRRAWKKRVYIALFRLLQLHQKVIWHSTADHETVGIRDIWGSSVRVIQRSADTLLPPRSLKPPDDTSGRVRAVFLGRIVEHKGLHIALEALRTCDAPIGLDVFGIVEDGEYFRRCTELARGLPADVSVLFKGVVRPEDVRDVLFAHDVLLMPTAGENFGHIIAEALSAACIVVTTPDTPWSGVLSSGGGRVVPREVASWASAIESLANTSREEVVAMRRAAGAAFDAWVKSPQPLHIWALVLEQVSGKR